MSYYHEMLHRVHNQSISWAYYSPLLDINLTPICVITPGSPSAFILIKLSHVGRHSTYVRGISYYVCQFTVSTQGVVCLYNHQSFDIPLLIERKKKGRKNIYLVTVRHPHAIDENQIYIYIYVCIT